MDLAHLTQEINDLSKQAADRQAQIARLSLVVIARQIRDTLPEAVTVGLQWSEQEPRVDPAGYYTASGHRIGTSATDPVPDGDWERRLDDAIRPYTGKLTEANEEAWAAFFSTADPVTGAVLDLPGRLDLAEALSIGTGFTPVDLTYFHGANIAWIAKAWTPDSSSDMWVLDTLGLRIRVHRRDDGTEVAIDGHQAHYPPIRIESNDDSDHFAAGSG